MKIFLWMLGILVGLLVLAWLAISIFFPDEKIKNMLVAELEDLLGVEVQAGELNLEIFSGLALKDVVVGAPPSFDRSPVRVERLLVDYSLGEIFSKKLTINRVLIHRPEIDIRVRAGRSNVSTWFERRRAGKGESPEETETKDDPGGFVLALKQVEVLDARLSVRLPGFSADLSDLNVSAVGKLGSPGETFIQTRSRLPVPAEPNLVADLERGPDGAAKIGVAFGFDVETSLIGQTRVESSGRFELRLPGLDGSEAGRRLTADYVAHADLAASEAILTKLEVKLDDRPVLSASGGMTGLSQNTRVWLRAPYLMPPPELIAELLGRILPGVEVAGSLHIENLSLEGPLDGSLPGGSARVVLDNLSVSTKGLKLTGLSGKLQAGFQPQAGGGEYTFQSTLFARAGRLSTLRAKDARMTMYASGSLQMQAGEPKLISPELGAWVRLKSLRGRGFSCRSVDFQGRVTTGAEPVSIGWPDVEVPSLGANFRVKSAGVSMGSVRVRPDAVKLWLSAQGLSRSGRKWRIGKLLGKLDLDLRRVVAGAGEVDRIRVAVDLKGAGLASGRRFGRPLRLSVRVRSDAAKTDPVSARTVDLRLETRLRGPAPASWPLSLDLSAAGVVLGGGKLSLPREVKLALTSVLDVRGGTLAVERLEAGLGDLIALEASGRLAFGEGKVKVDFGIKPFSIERVVAALPGDIGRGLPRLKGELELSGKTRVTLPKGELDLEKLKHTTEATLFLRGVRGALAGSGLEWTDVSGRLKLTAPGPGTQKAAAQANLTVGRARLKSRLDLSGAGLVLAAKARRDGEDYSLDGRITASKLNPAGALSRPLINSRVDFYGRLVGAKELRLKYIQVVLPSLGADLSVGGRFVHIPGAAGFEALRVSAKVEAGLRSPTPVSLPGGLTASGEGSLSLSVDSGSDGVLSVRGRISFDRLDLKGADFELDGVRGSIPVSQRIATRPTLGLLAGKSGGEQNKAAAASARFGAYEEALLPMKGRQRSFSVDRVKYRDLQLTHLTGNLELAQGSLKLGSLRLRFLEGDVLAEAAVAFAPPRTRRLSLDAQVSGVDLSGLGALQLAGSSDIGGNLRLKLDMGEKVFTAAVNLTKIGRSTLQALLVAMDRKESNPGILELRRFLNRFKVSPQRVSMDIRHGLLNMEVVLNLGLAARAVARLTEGFEGNTYKLKHLPVGGLIDKYLKF